MVHSKQESCSALRSRAVDATGTIPRGERRPLGATGTFRFFTPGDVETVTEVLDGCDVQGVNNYRVVSGGLTNVEVDITVTGTQSDVTRTDSTPLDTPLSVV